MIIDTEGNQLRPKPYTNEDELQKHIFNHPELLSESDDDRYIPIAREVTTDAGRIDALMLSKTGNVVVVEVKLSRNQQSRREIVAQIVDYVSTLSELSVYELDEKTHSKLIAKIEDTDYEPQTVDKLLRNADIEVILVVDETNESLNRIVQFLADHTDFKISLVEVSQHLDNDRVILSSSTIIYANGEHTEQYPTSGPKRYLEQRSTLDKIAEAWNQTDFAKKYSLFTKGNASTYRQVIVPEWPSTLHYEFTYSRNAVYVRLDNELAKTDPRKEEIFNIMQRFIGQTIDNYTVAHLSNSRNIIYIAILDPANINEIVSAMQKLIEATKHSFDGIATQQVKPRSNTTFSMLGLKPGDQLRCIQYPNIIVTVADEINQIIDPEGNKRTISNYANEIFGGNNNGFAKFTYANQDTNNKNLYEIRNELEQTNGGQSYDN